MTRQLLDHKIISRREIVAASLHWTVGSRWDEAPGNRNRVVLAPGEEDLEGHLGFL